MCVCICIMSAHRTFFNCIFFIKQIFLGASMQSIKVFSPKNDWMPKHIFSLYFIYNLKDAKLVTEQSSASYLFPICVPLSQQSIVSWLKK